MCVLVSVGIAVALACGLLNLERIAMSVKLLKVEVAFSIQAARFLWSCEPSNAGPSSLGNGSDRASRGSRLRSHWGVPKMHNFSFVPFGSEICPGELRSAQRSCSNPGSNPKGTKAFTSKHEFCMTIICVILCILMEGFPQHSI